MYFSRSCIIALIPLSLTSSVAAQEAVEFGDWQAFCAPVAGCVLGVKSGEGDTLAFVEPPSGDDRLLMFLEEPVRPGSEIEVSLDDRVIVTLGPADGWRLVESDVGAAFQIAPSIVREALSEPMKRRNDMTLSYSTSEGSPKRVTFSLNGYADTRGYAEDE